MPNTPILPRFAATALVAILSPLLLLLLGCSSGSPSSPEQSAGAEPAVGEKLRVATTVSPITSLVENIAGDRIILEGIVPEGTNSHTFEPSPSVATILGQADLFVANGLFLEEPTIQLAQSNLPEGARTLLLAEKTITRDEWVFDFSFPESDGHPNPHLWTAPHLAVKYAELIKLELSEMDSANAAYYEENFGKLRASIEDLDERISEAVKTIPPENRKLLTYHDSFPYFGPRYGFEIIGAIQPSDFSEPSTREVARLIDQVRETRVPAIFGSEVFPSPVMEQIAREGGAAFVDRLRDDDLPGEYGDSNHTYMGLILEDARIITESLGGDASPLEGYDPSPVIPGPSGAIYPQ